MHFERLHERCACGSAFSNYSANYGAAQAADGDLASKFVLQGTTRVFERARPFRIDHISLELTIDDKNGRLVGVATLAISRVDQAAELLRLDAINFDIDKVQLGGIVRTGGKRSAAKRSKTKASFRATEFVYDDSSLEVPIASNVDCALVRVTYSATPTRGMYFIRPDEAYPDKPNQVWTQCQDEDARHIFPCHDKPHIKQTMDLQVKVRSGWQVVSNGQIKGNQAQRKKGNFTFQMDNRLPTYLFTIVAGDFAVIDAKAGKLPIQYLVPPGREADGRRTFRNTPKMIRFFSECFGMPYPWTKYVQVVVSDFIFGGMENTGATTMYEHILLDKRASLDASSDDLIAHELAHQWFGDLVTCRDWSHAWLNEGFATFSEHVWREHNEGSNDYFEGLRVDLANYLHEANSRYRRPVVCQDYLAPIDLFDRHLYEKGGLVLHSLRMLLGDDVFWSGITLYLSRHAGGVVETRDLLRALEEVSGRSLEREFQQFLERKDYPNLDINVTYREGELSVAVKQALGKGAEPFELDLTLDVATGTRNKVERKIRRVTQKSQTFVITTSQRPNFVVVDAEQRVLGRVNCRAPGDMLRAQLKSAPTARGQALGAKALRGKEDKATLRALKAALQSKAHFSVRTAAARALASLRGGGARDALIEAAGVESPKVRRAVAMSLGQFRQKSAATALIKLATTDESYLVRGSACRALGSTRRPEAFDVLVELLSYPSYADVVRSGAIDGLARMRDERAIDHLCQAAEYGQPQRSRRVAIGALARTTGGRKVREQLIDLLEDSDPHVRVRIAIALGDLGDEKARPALQEALSRDFDARVRRRLREVLRDFGKGDLTEVKRLRDELSSLKYAQQSLKVRVAKLESSAKETAGKSTSRRKR